MAAQTVPSEGSSTPSPKVIVVGAGIAGLACAHALLRAGVDVEVLEARERVGGRVWTLRDLVDGFPVEAGAMMVHGRDASLLRWISEFGLNLRLVPTLRGGRFFYEGKLRRTGALAFSRLRNLRAGIQTLWTLPRAIEHYRGPDMTLSEFLARRRALPLTVRLAGNMYAGVNAADADELSVRGLGEEANVSSLGLPWRNYQVGEGLDAITTKRAQSLGGRIRLRARVERIEWAAQGVRIAATGPQGRETIDADAAVVTVPLGVLKAGDIVFEPPLPEEKRRAIDTLGYGHANKVLLAFDASLHATVLGRAAYLADEEGSWYFLPFRGRRDAPVVIEGFVSGRRARELSSMPAQEALDAVLARFERMLPGTDLRGHLLAAKYIDWTSDPYSRGAYSFPTLEGKMETRRRLAEPLGDVLFFAGEATHAQGEYATIHGALDSGDRAAREVVARASRRSA